MPTPRRGLRLLPLIALVYCLSASGPFGIEEIVPASGPGLSLLLILLLPIFYGLPLGLAAGEMGSRFPVEGGYYRWIRHVFGDFWGFQAGWWAWMGGLFDGALYASLVAEYSMPFVNAWLPAAWTQPARHLVALLVIVGCTWANLRGIQIVGWSSLVFALFIISPFALLCGLGLLHWTHNPIIPFKPPDKGWLEALGVGTLIGMWSYSGYESLSTAAEELENPRRNYLRAVVIAIIVTVPTYLLPVLAGLATAPDWTAFSAGSFTDMGRSLGGAGLETWIAAAGIISMLALFNGYTLAYSRIPFTMAQDGFLPRTLARTHSKHGTPWVALLVGACIYASLTFFTIENLVVLEMWCFSGLYVVIYLALWRLRCRPDLDAGSKEGEYRFIIPAGRRGIWFVILPPMALIVMAMFGSGREYIYYGGPAILSGALIYPFVARMRRVGLFAPAQNEGPSAR
ncbi:MAG TPA: APC family permease [Candidatus Polarisedimenticolia bacterium]|nr:APC family permease [Candidatus Polarisedimenticolia bacterium]